MRRKKATENEKLLQEALNTKNRKIAELESNLETTQSILAHLKSTSNKEKVDEKMTNEEVTQSGNDSKTKANSPTKSTRRCKFENTGTFSRNKS